jgi:hypothetical protein
LVLLGFYLFAIGVAKELQQLQHLASIYLKCGAEPHQAFLAIEFKQYLAFRPIFFYEISLYELRNWGMSEV